MNDKNRKIYGYLMMVIDMLFIGLARFVNNGTVDAGLYGLLFIVVICENIWFFSKVKKKKTKPNKE